MKKDHFAHKSKSWDMSSRRVKNAKSIANAIIDSVELSEDMTIMDFGAGTGLLSYFIAPFVDTIVAVDVSPSMLNVFSQKSDEFECNIEIIEADLSTDKIDRKFDGIISSMTLHHLEDTTALLYSLYDMLESDGFIALADLDSEDGTFHSDNRGVHHFGFDRDSLQKIAKTVGFQDISIETVSSIEKPHREFTTFLMVAKK